MLLRLPPLGVQAHERTDLCGQHLPRVGRIATITSQAPKKGLAFGDTSPPLPTGLADTAGFFFFSLCIVVSRGHVRTRPFSSPTRLAIRRRSETLPIPSLRHGRRRWCRHNKVITVAFCVASLLYATQSAGRYGCACPAMGLLCRWSSDKV